MERFGQDRTLSLKSGCRIVLLQRFITLLTHYEALLNGGAFFKTRGYGNKPRQDPRICKYIELSAW